MKFLYLMYKTYSRFFLRELFLMLQILAVIVTLNTALLPFADYAHLYTNIVSGLPKTSLYYSTPLFAPVGEEQSADYIQQFYTDNRIEDVCLTYHTSGTVNGVGANIYLYNAAMFQYIDFPLAEGKWQYNTNTVYINSYIDSHFPTQNGLDICIDDGLITMEKTYTVGGVINSYDMVYDFGQAGSNPEYAALSRDYASIRHFNPSHTKLLVILPFELETIDGIGTFMPGSLLKLKEGVSPERFAASFDQSAGNGRTISLAELSENSLHRLITTYKMEAMLSILLILSVIFSIGGYTYLKLTAMKKQAGIYFLCGCKKRYYALITMISHLPVLLIPTGLAFLARDFLIFGEGYDTVTSLLIAVTFVCMAFILPLLLTLRHVKKLSFSELVYYGD